MKGVRKLTDERFVRKHGCDKCWYYYSGAHAPTCHYPGKKIYGGECIGFKPKDVEEDRAGNEYAGTSSSYEQFQKEWN